ncbi:MipA/OmpV family protein [Histidinibacterium aquaticum]|uniref:MipA/OmpV family protein n=1 Tax=Histidinibacterium aquaticum TaxID=2613962 RepID=A0A5J5GP92_9RHOB|nr:MipA/OmpV family protein [Histidinibacterium aquaticum]KAA9009877.1 MipA/OmpV family protein [Histidinibacterium aquaticum]
MKAISLFVSAALGLGGGTAVQAQVSDASVAFTLSGGIQAKPEYFGSEDLAFGPDVGLSNLSLSYGARELGGGPQTGFGLRGSFRYVPERSASDFSELRGLEDVDATYELGAGVGYTSRDFEAFADLRYGIQGHESLVAELGANAVFRPSQQLTMRLGPRVLLGSEDYADTYFSVTPSEAAASGGRFAAYDAEAGALSTGVELGVTYQIDENWGIDGAVTYEQFVGSAADSPIIEQGSDDQVSISVGVTRNLSLDF